MLAYDVALYIHENNSRQAMTAANDWELQHVLRLFQNDAGEDEDADADAFLLIQSIFESQLSSSSSSSSSVGSIHVFSSKSSLSKIFAKTMLTRNNNDANKAGAL